MICQQCGTFIPVSEAGAGQPVVCPVCRAEQTADRSLVKIRCPECRQPYELEAWQEGDTFVCESCGKTIQLTRDRKAPAPAAPAPEPPQKSASPVPRFRSAGGAGTPPKKTAAPAAPAPALEKAAPAAPRIQKGNVPPPPPRPAAPAAPAFSRAAAPAEPAPAEPAADAAAEPAAASADLAQLLPEAEHYLQEVNRKPPAKSFPPETEKQCYLREKFKPRLRITLNVAAICLCAVVVLVLLQLFFSLAGMLNGRPSAKNEKAEWQQIQAILSDPSKSAPEIQEALQKNGRSIDLVFADGSTLLERAAALPSEKALPLLLEADADPDQPFRDGLAPLFHFTDKPEVFRLLLQHGADIHVTDWEGAPLSSVLLAKKQYELLSNVIHRQKSFAPADRNGNTLLMLLLADDGVPERAALLKFVLQHPCAINAVNGEGKSALQLFMERQSKMPEAERSEVLRQLLAAGAAPYGSFESSLKDTPLDEVYQQFRKEHGLDPVPAAVEKEPVHFCAPWQAVPDFGPPDWGRLLFIVLYMAAGLGALQLARPPKSKKWEKFQDLVLLAGGIFSLGYLVVTRFCGGVILTVRKAIDWVVNRIHEDQVSFMMADGQPLPPVEDPEIFLGMNAMQRFFNRYLRKNVGKLTFVPYQGQYQITTPDGTKERLLTHLDLPTGNRILRVMKTLAGMNAFEMAQAQNGAFMLSLLGVTKRAALSTIGIGALGERANLVLSDPDPRAASFDQLRLAPADQQKLAGFLSGSGLVIVAGPEGCGRRTFVSFLLDKIAETSGSAVWIGNGKESAGSAAVPRLKTDPVKNVTLGQLLAAVPEYPAVAVTMGTDLTALPQLLAMAAQKKVILLWEKPLNEALACCRKASAPLLEAHLCLAVRPWLLRKLCSCAKMEPVPPLLAPLFAQAECRKGVVSTANGCPACLAKGTLTEFVLYETAGANGLPPRPEVTTALLTVLKLADAGVIGLADVELFMKGE